MSLAIYASSFLLVVSWPYTAGLILLSWVALVPAIATAPTPLDGPALATIVFYLGTASGGRLRRADPSRGERLA